MTATITSFPLSKHTGGDGATHAFSSPFIYISHVRCPFPPLQWRFPHTTTFTSFPAPRFLVGWLLQLACLFTIHVGSDPSTLSSGVSSHCHFYKLSCSKIAGWVPPLLPSPAGLFIYSSHVRYHVPTLQWRFPHSATFTSFSVPRLLGRCHHYCLLQPACLFTVLWGTAPAPLFGVQGTPPSLLCVFFIVVYYSIWGFFLFFSLGGGRSVQGAILIWPRVVWGSTTCCWAHLVVCIFPSGLEAGILQCRSPPGFCV
jgi:hypothetical protein